jgi:hypothetical protein
MQIQIFDIDLLDIKQYLQNISGADFDPFGGAGEQTGGSPQPTDDFTGGDFTGGETAQVCIILSTLLETESN